MLIFYYVSLGVVALGVVVAAAGAVFALRYGVITRHPPDSEEDEQRRSRIGITAASLVIIGLLLCGVGILFQ
jgi:hypothetical protein